MAAGTDTPDRESFRSVLTWQTVVAATVLAALAAGAFLWFAAGGSDDSAEIDGGINVPLTEQVAAGDALDVELTLPDQESTTTLRDLLDGRPMVVNLFAEWCTPCIKEMPDLQQVYSELDGSVDFVGIASEDRPEETAKIVEQTGVTYPWFSDNPGNMIAAIEGTAMPTTFFVAADGTIVTMRAGALEIDALRDLITESFPEVT